MAKNVFARSQWPWPLTFGHQNLVASSLSPGGHVYQIRRNSVKAFLRYCVHKNGMDWQSENITPLASTVPSAGHKNVNSKWLKLLKLNWPGKKLMFLCSPSGKLPTWQKASGNVTKYATKYILWPFFTTKIKAIMQKTLFSLICIYLWKQSLWLPISKTACKAAFCVIIK